MALLSDYTSGTISVAADGTAVTGVGTGWVAAGFREGDLLFADGYTGVVKSVESNTALTLDQPWRGGALSGAAYRLRYQSDGSRFSAQARALIEMLGGSGNLEALGGLESAPNTLPYFTGSGQMGLTEFPPEARTLLREAGNALFRGDLPIYPTVQGLSSETIPADVIVVRINGYSAEDDGNGWPLAVEVENVGDMQPWQAPSNDGARRWQLVTNLVRPEMLGVLGNGSDETTKIQAMAAWTAANKIPVQWGNKEYAFQEILVQQDAIDVTWRSDGRTVLRSLKSTPDTVKGSLASWEADAFIDILPNSFRTVAGTAINAGDSYLTLDSTADIIPNDTLISVASTRVIETDNRGQARHGWQVPADRIISGTVVQLAKPAPVTCKVGDITGVTVVSVSGNNVVVSGLSAYSRTDVQYRLRFNTVGGAASTATVYPQDFDPVTQTYRFNATNGPVPAGLAPGDSITVERRVDITLCHSAKVDIGDGFVLERAAHTGATPGDLGFRGLRVWRGIAPKIKGMQLRNFSEAGIVISSSYAPRLSDIRVEGSNRAYNVFDGTGYGISCYQSSWGFFEDIVGFGCRRTLDIAGTQGVSYFTETKNIHGYGGGTAYDGVRFWPMGVTECSVVGSHGAAWYTRYAESRGFNVTAAVNLRGADEFVDGVYGAGNMNYLVHSFYGDGAVIDGMYYTDGAPDWVSNSGYAYGYSAGGKLLAALSIDASNIIKTKPHMLSNVHLRGVKRSLVEVQNAGSVGPIVISGAIDIVTDNADGDYVSFELIRAVGAGTKTLNGPFIVSEANILNNPSAPKTSVTLVNLTAFNLNGNYWKYGNQYFFTVPDDGVIKIPASRLGTTRMSLRLVNRDRTPGVSLNDAEVWVERAGDKSQVPNSRTVDILSTVLTGTTGADGRVSISYGPSGQSAIYIENRYGTSEQFVFECTMAI